MTISPALSPEQYAIERAICDKAQSYADSIMRPNGKYLRNYITADEAKDPAYAACDNAMRGRVEQFEILRDLPEAICAYVAQSGQGMSHSLQITVWTGDRLGAAQETAKWKTPRSFVSSTMHQYRATIGGKEYTGRVPELECALSFGKLPPASANVPLPNQQTVD